MNSYVLPVKTTRLGTIKNALSLIKKSHNLNEFAEGVVKCFMANLHFSDMASFINKMSDILGITIQEDGEFCT